MSPVVCPDEQSMRLLRVLTTACGVDDSLVRSARLSQLEDGVALTATFELLIPRAGLKKALDEVGLRDLLECCKGP